MAKRTERALGKSSKTNSILTERSGKKVKISLRVPDELDADVLDAMRRDDYPLKRKSLWIEQALLGMARHDPDMSESLVGDKAQGPIKKRIVVVFSSAAKSQLKDSMIRLRLQMPTIEGVQSVVMRCAMRFRIRHPEYFSDGS